MSEQPLTASRAALLSDMHRLAEDVKSLAKRISEHLEGRDAAARRHLLGALYNMLTAQNYYKGETP